MIDVKQAVRKAVEYCHNLYQDRELELEEVELTDDNKYWLITLSYLAPVPLKKNIADITKILTAPPLHKEYKILRLNSENGEVLSMKIREAS